MNQFAAQALAEYNSDTATVRHGGINGNNFWNMHASQFMFVPAFQFPALPACKEYIYTATDCNGNIHTFTHKKSTAPLTPIWKDIPVGMVELKVEGRHSINQKLYVSGMRTFYKSSGFPGREALPAGPSSYKDAAIKAYRYAFNNDASQYWLRHGKPDPNYYHNVYPSKTIKSVVNTMLDYAEIEPPMAADALKLATNAADYLLSITYGEDYALANVPPTYSFKGLNKEIVDGTAPAADGRRDQVMNIYPAGVGCMYLRLEAATGEQKYFNAARSIAEYYQANVLPNGSWYLLVNAKTGEHESFNCCMTYDILEFLMEFYQRTGEECWHELERGYFEFLRRNCLETYNWEGQFEDIQLSGGFVNLTHFLPDNLITYITKNLADDPAMMHQAEQLMRYVEDQFVVWGEFAPWSAFRKEGDIWFSPVALEQYFWYVPIDASAAKIATTFLDLYDVTNNELYLEKARALIDSIARMQNPENGVIPTHWMKEDCATNLENFWINCHSYSANALLRMAKILGEC